MDDHVRLGRQYPITVLQHQFNMMNLAILICGSKDKKKLIWGSKDKKIVEYIFLISNVSAEKCSHTFCTRYLTLGMRSA